MRNVVLVLRQKSKYEQDKDFIRSEHEQGKDFVMFCTFAGGNGGM